VGEPHPPLLGGDPLIAELADACLGLQLASGRLPAGSFRRVGSVRLAPVTTGTPGTLGLGARSFRVGKGSAGRSPARPWPPTPCLLLLWQAFT
jgi:hypothetical protein